MDIIIARIPSRPSLRAHRIIRPVHHETSTEGKRVHDASEALDVLVRGEDLHWRIGSLPHIQSKVSVDLHSLYDSLGIQCLAASPSYL